MTTKGMKINELEAQIEHLQDRLDNLRSDFNNLEHLQDRLDNLKSDFNNLEDFVTKKLTAHIDDRFAELEDYLNIERVKDNTYYRSKEKTK